MKCGKGTFKIRGNGLCKVNKDKTQAWKLLIARPILSGHCAVRPFEAVTFGSRLSDRNYLYLPSHFQFSSSCSSHSLGLEKRKGDEGEDEIPLFFFKITD